MNAERLHINTFEGNVVRLQRNKNQHDKEEFLFSRSNSFMMLASSQETAQQLIGKQTDEVRIVGGNQYMFSRNQPDERVICVNCPTRH
jgi:NifU-like protein involved in Fe-S cluster formation